MAKSRVAVVIPAYSSNDELGNWALRTAKTWKSQCDDLIISEDGSYHKGLHQLADLYLLHEQLWPAKNMNLGWHVALMRGADYVAIMDLDAHHVDGSLREACLPGKVTVPSIVQHPETVNIGPMFIVPKEVAIDRGFLDAIAGPRLQWFDTDYQVRVHDILTQSRQLKVYHEGGSVTGVHPTIPQPPPAIPENLVLTREIDPMRHAQRMQQEPKYRMEHTP